MKHKLLFLGTGAADIDFDTEPEKSFANKSFRRCSCAIIDEHIMLDCGPFAINSLDTAGISLENVTDIVFTHLHPDHFSQKSAEKIALAKSKPLNIWVRFDAELPKLENCIVHKTELFCEHEIGGLKITTVPANHFMYPQHIIVNFGEKKFLYATDGAWMLSDEVNFLKNAEFDIVAIDSTVGDYLGDYRMGEHNSIPMIRLMVPSLMTNGIICDKTRIILTHLAMSLHKSYEETVEAVKADGFEVAYDGYEIDI